MIQYRAAPTGNGSIAVDAAGFLTKQPPEILKDGIYNAHLWQTVGVDFSKTSGAEALWVFVGGQFGFGQRPVDWSLDLGTVSPGELKWDGAEFHYTPRGSDLTLSGLLLCPADAEWSETREGGNVHVHTWLRTPDEGREFTWSETPAGFDLTLEGDGPVHQEQQKKQRQRQEHAETLRQTISNVTTDNSMGAPSLKRRVRSHYVVVLMLHRGPAPAVTVADGKDQLFLTVGKQRIRYWEFLVEFEKGMRDVLSGMQSGSTP